MKIIKVFSYIIDKKVMNKFAKIAGVSLATLVLAAFSAQIALAAVTATITSPVAGSTYNVGQTVNLAAASSGTNLTVNYVWSFSDGTAGFTGQTGSVAFSTPGTKTITVMAGDSSGANDVETVNITVNATASQKPVISNIDWKDVTQTGVTITWDTNIPATSRVIYDTVSHPGTPDSAAAPNFGYANSTTEADVTTKVTNHSVTITGLAPGTKYYFRVLSRG
ncbi:MAG: hypothetical protein COV08_01585 [Candidatus Vogelbacteria bacterium CG10_big_fil_rev_8_21_14_0_10_49_38]|uniref:PKD domain-containing protein n=1 Tax=Candidatus Vogelbacteria bacterium CG10_big_fil_rev_8_21_14_0_10_49_38 TaxID=1975043 RepID=A0A2H0RI29_9BACT|nr:MAG: hypothetical protein BK006_01600 [bacterium CG10_49_38]PIR46090.1 MAG: hypothetical protein COV08_01585 [Candidatus Vogelbacteria bacterium CG10_big_fil_rev_8_21_14_0_10_49_38]